MVGSLDYFEMGLVSSRAAIVAAVCIFDLLLRVQH